MSKYMPKRGDIAEYTWPIEFGDLAGTVATGHVLAVGKTYADVRWHEGRVERIRFRNPDGVTFKPADTN